mgnify:CR=1 FL=1
MDLEQRTHEQCAAQMDISRSTVQEIYESARQKIAACLVHGKPLRITGGNYRICGGEEHPHCGRSCRMRTFNETDHKQKGEPDMKIAVTYQDGDIFQHFGHTEFFKIYDIENTDIVKTEIVSTNGSGHGALAQFLHEHSVDTLICGGIGGGAQMALSQAGIKLYGGVTGKADDAVNALLNNKLNYDPAVKCDHHEQEHGGAGHTCGAHGCGSNSHHGH